MMQIDPTTNMTQLILAVFKCHGLLLAAGDTLGKDLGISSAKWKVMGGIALDNGPKTVAQVARRMGLSRQAVQRIVNGLLQVGHVETLSNPDHQRAPLLRLTRNGQQTYDAIMRRQLGWSAALAAEFSVDDVTSATQCLNQIVEKLS